MTKAHNAENGFLLYKREKEGKSVYIYINNSSKCEILNLPEIYENYFTKVILKNEIIINPYSYGILIKKEH